ncbi:ribonuclease HII [Ferrimicrobium sp.]|uniref:ribonuclease HII n=1 Tax=Ferrimicrobium sp. TaxID=2926050 RepID=UPI002630745C|nr:ribonuclease HII [Ferrimicrobium sp.]
MSVGMDEVGRGAWAGPLAVGAASGDIEAAAIVLKRSRGAGYYDSKALSAGRRQTLFARLADVGVVFGIGFASVVEIDALGLTHSLSLAAERALRELELRLPCPLGERTVYLDGTINYLTKVKVITLVGGDGIHPLIAAASIAAKLARDSLMIRLDAELPYWDFDSSKGYGSLRHRFGLSWQGPSVEHRRSFRPVHELRAPASTYFSSPAQVK